MYPEITRYNKILSVILAVVLFLSALPLPVFSVDSKEAAQTEAVSTLYINQNGVQTNYVELRPHEKLELSVEGAEEGYQWQILHPEKEDLWVNIYDATHESIAVSLALVGNMLDSGNAAALRCRAVVDGEVRTSAPVTVQLLEEEATVMVVEEMELPAVAEPVEEIPAAVEETEPAAGAAEAEETAPAVEAEETEPAVEATEAAEETEPAADTMEPTEESLAAEMPTAEVFAMPRSISGANDGIMGLAEEDAEDSDFVTVTIEYVRYDFKWEDGKLVVDAQGNPVLEENGIMAFTPYIATLQKGTDLNTIVNNPTMVGYDTFLGDENEISTSVRIDKTNITEDITYTVKYKPALVDYSVRYYFQNVYDDLYVEDTAQMMELAGATGSTPPENIVNKQFEGFTSLYYQPDTIAADGSTVFEVYYERNYYLMEFDCAGGYGTDTVYVRCGTYISIPSPIRSGYVFNGWDLVRTEQEENLPALADGVVDALPSEMPKYNTAYVALWSTTDTKYTIVYWKANLATEKDAEGNTTYSYWGRETIEDTSAKTLIPTEVGAEHPVTGVTSDADFDTSEAPYFTYDAAATAANNPASVTIEGDGSTIINVYYSRKSYQLKFYYARTNTSGGEIRIANSTGSGYQTTANREFSNISWANPDSSALPAITDSYFTSGEGEHGNDKIGNVLYHYLAFNAEFGANIEDEWPANALGSLSNGNWNFGSWAAESGSAYRENDAEHANIVGAYPYLTADLIVDPDAEIGHHFVAWWGRQDGTWYGGGYDNVAPHYYHIYYEVLPGQENDADVVTYTYNGVTKHYKLSRDLVFNAAHKASSPTRVDAFEYNGYTVVGTGEDADSSNNYDDAHDHYCNTYYYNRDLNTLSFYNHNTLSNEAGKTLASATLMYEQPLADGLPADVQAPYEPPYPEGIEPGAYEFQGWYTTAGCYAGTEVDWDTMKMPDGHMTVYAKWTPVTHTVTFYQLYDDVGSENWLYDGPKEVTHGELLETAYDLIPTREGYTFVGWFYFDEDNKKRFAPDSMEIVRDVDLFAEWQSGIDTTYEVTYVLQDAVTIGDVTYPAGTPIAAPTTGHSTAGKTKTFTAKGMGELYPAFQTGIFPTLNSHSILMREDGSENTFQFTYTHDDEVWYKVRYVDYVTRTEIATSVTKSTSNAIVTEKFLPISGYIPQNFYIRKALVADGSEGSSSNVKEENIITFYYTEDKSHGLYSVEYYLENADSQDSSKVENYTQYESIVGSADNNTTYTAEVRSYKGYTYDPTLNTVITYSVSTDSSGNVTVTEHPVYGTEAGDPPRGTVDYTGLTIKIYYQRNEYPYIIEYREYGAAEGEGLLKTITSSDSKAKFDAKVSHTAPGQFVDTKGTDTTTDDITYEYYIADASDAQRTKEMTIRMVEDGNENPNKLIFYFTQKKVEIQYHPVCKETLPAGTSFGRVSINKETVTSVDHLAGSTAMVEDGFTFVGWYKDADCTVPVDAAWITGDTHIKPGELIQDEDWINHYYALFAPVQENLTITKQGENLGDDTFLFQITATNVLDQKVDLIVSIQGAGSVTIQGLYCGDYTVTELTNWSWTYDCTDGAVKTASLSSADDQDTYTVTFTNSPKAVDWLHGESEAEENQFQ